MMTADTSALPIKASAPSFHFNYTVQEGIFQQSDDKTLDKNFNFIISNFGLIDRVYPTDSSGEDQEKLWVRFERYVKSKQEDAKEGEKFKVLFLARHGEGEHNVAEAKYGTEAWDRYFSALPPYHDAQLTPLGQSQALTASQLWLSQLLHGLPSPSTYYVSPLTRTIQTADITFTKLPLPASKPYKPRVKELVREVMGIHTCDRRSNMSQLQHQFPHLTFEPGFAEGDELWKPDYREPRGARRYRLAMFLDDVFSHDEGLFLSFTTHSGAIASLLEVMGHRVFALETGGVIPVFVRGVRVGREREVPEPEPSDAEPMWVKPPAGTEERLR